MQTTMDKLGNGVVFHFAPRNPNHPGFVKVSNMFAIDLTSMKISPNCFVWQDAGKIEVCTEGEKRRDLIY